ncbi:MULTISPECIES: hypothetical protein, partial [unclassified Roseovarius]|uniref:hypothetical protein n=1 Tax=unclassified Roseovarius TaxID=2614913 RepID=UPI00273D849C
NWPRKAIKPKPRTLRKVEETWGSGQPQFCSLKSGQVTPSAGSEHKRADNRFGSMSAQSRWPSIYCFTIFVHAANIRKAGGKRSI